MLSFLQIIRLEGNDAKKGSWKTKRADMRIFLQLGAMLSFLQIIRLEGDMLLQLSSIFSSSKQLNLSHGGGAKKNIMG